MAYQQYKFNFYLNARHAIYINGKQGQHHPHTWQISLYVVKVTDRFVMFNKVERAVEDLMAELQDIDINDHTMFANINPTLENITEVLFQNIQKKLSELGWLAYTMEVSETPTRSYIVSLGESDFQGVDDETLRVNRIIEKSFQ